MSYLEGYNFDCHKSVNKVVNVSVGENGNGHWMFFPDFCVAGTGMAYFGSMPYLLKTTDVSTFTTKMEG
jgi:hypothetical protein